jgi:hypothetical protein
MPADHDLAHQIIARHYLLFAIGLSLGALQVAAGMAGLRGMSLGVSPRSTRLAGFAVVVASTVLFFLAPLWTDGPWAAGTVDSGETAREWGRASLGELAGAYNVNDIDGGLSGTDQALYFPIGFGIALALSLAGGALLQPFRKGRSSPATGYADGLAMLEQHAYVPVLRASLKGFFGSWREDLRREFDSSRHPHGIPARTAGLRRRR